MMSTCSITSHEAENLMKKLDSLESRLISLETTSADPNLNNVDWMSQLDIEATSIENSPPVTTVNIYVPM